MAMEPFVVLGHYPSVAGGEAARDAAAEKIHEALIGKCSYTLGYCSVAKEPKCFGFLVSIIECIDTDAGMKDVACIVEQCMTSCGFLVEV